MSAPLARAMWIVVLLAGTSGCSPGGGQWHKPGADEQTITRDSSECRAAAQEEAERRYPFRAASPALGAAGIGLSQQRDDHARAVAEASLFNSYMQGRGYAR